MPVVSMEVEFLDEALLYFNFFPKECGIRNDISRTVHQPIHHIIKDRKVFYTSRSEKVDVIAAEAYKPFQKLDQGHRPYFSHPTKPPVHVDRRRIDRLLDESPDRNMINWPKAMAHVYGRNKNPTPHI